MELQDFEALKVIPGYTSILKAVLKSQIQLLVEQLCHQTGEESIILTACVSDGTLCHLGSVRGKHFLEGREELKSAFLNHCLTVAEPEKKRATKRSQPPAVKKKLTTITSPAYSDKLFSSRVLLDPISNVTDADNKAVLNLNIPGDKLETVQVSLNDYNDDDNDDNDTDNYMESIEQGENNSHNLKSKRSKRKRRKGGRKGTLGKKGKHIINEVAVIDNQETFPAENVEEEEGEIEIIGFEMGGNSKGNSGLDHHSSVVEIENEKGEESNHSEIKSIFKESDEGFKLKLTRLKQSKHDSEVHVVKHVTQPSNTMPLELTKFNTHAQFDREPEEEEDPDEPPILKPTPPKFSNEAYEKNFKSFIQEKDPGRLLAPNESATMSETPTVTQEVEVHHGYPGRNTFPCEYCKRTYSTLGSLRRHEYIHIDGGPFYCCKCKRSFVNKKGLDTHYLFTDHDKT